MNKAKFAVFGAVLTGVVALAVSSLAAQTRLDDQRREQAERSRPQVMVLDWRGAHIGVTVEDVSEQDLEAVAGIDSGVRIADVDPDGPASKAGLREGDLVVEFDGDRVRSARQFSRLVQETPDGHDVTLGIIRDGQRQTLNVTPASPAFAFGFDGDRISRQMARSMRDIEPRLRDLEPRLREIEPHLREFRFHEPFDFDFDFDALPRMTSPRARLGVRLQELTPQLAEYFGATEGGVLVSSVTPDSPAARAGIKAGDVITSIDGDRVGDTDDLVDELRDKEGEVAVGILRDTKESSVIATLETSQPRRPLIRRPA